MQDLEGNVEKGDRIYKEKCGECRKEICEGQRGRDEGLRKSERWEKTNGNQDDNTEGGHRKYGRRKKQNGGLKQNVEDG